MALILCDSTKAAVEDVGEDRYWSERPCLGSELSRDSQAPLPDDMRYEEAAEMLLLALFLWVASVSQARLRSEIEFQRAFDEAEAAVLLAGIPICAGNE